jgi:hypothetical protein
MALACPAVSLRHLLLLPARALGTARAGCRLAEINKITTRVVLYYKTHNPVGSRAPRFEFITAVKRVDIDRSMPLPLPYERRETVVKLVLVARSALRSFR